MERLSWSSRGSGRMYDGAKPLFLSACRKARPVRLSVHEDMVLRLRGLTAGRRINA